MPAPEIVIRGLAALVGGYAVTWTLVAALSTRLPGDQATPIYGTGAMALTPLVATILWAFTARPLIWAWGLPVVLSTVFGLLAWL